MACVPLYQMDHWMSLSVQRLKVYATKVTEDTGVSEKLLHDFIDTGEIYYMLIDIKASLLLRSEGNRSSILADLKELLESKDLKVFVATVLYRAIHSGLQNRLTACMLSPNLTAYVIDMHGHIMEFIRERHEVFKVPQSLFEDVELSAQFSKIVSELLASIRGNIKTKV
ncbi:hypothetical protein K503DRAFT_833181, partial [Rhizopogon vinicolor AM-OR11-026]